jgi:sugar transferase (PEP-CTERM/EpsH1 system associated)
VKILYLAHRIPYPPNKGEKIRVFNQIRQLSRKHTVHLCSFADDPNDLPQATHLNEYCASVEIVYRNNAAVILRAMAALLQRRPLSIKLFYRKALAKVIHRKLMQGFDCVMVSCSSMAQYVDSRVAIPKIIDFIDVDSEKWRMYADHHPFPFSIVYRREASLLARQEVRLMHEFDYSIVSSEPEAQLLRCQAKDRPIAVITNGVDFDFFSVPATAARTNDEPIIVFTGAMDYFPNIDSVQYFCDDIFPLIRNSIPNAHFYIVGRNPSRAVKKLQRQGNVFVTGSVPDVRPYLTRAGVAVAPFRIARGVQNKVLESMAMGVPVVGTTEAFKGIAAAEQNGIRIADDPRSFARRVITFLQGDATLRREAGLQARRYVERHHRWEDQGAKLERLIEEVVRKHRRNNSAVHHRDTEIAGEFA